jgi:glutamine cyclotransferase
MVAIGGWSCLPATPTAVRVPAGRSAIEQPVPLASPTMSELGGSPAALPSVLNGTPAALESLRMHVVATYPHDPEAFTQGLLWYQGQLYESTGLYGRSSLRRVEVETGRVLRQVDVAPQRFAEGLALVGERLVQLTWRENVAMVYRRDDFDPIGELSYDGEGWGLCYDGQYLVRSDGSATLFRHDPDTFEVVDTVAVLRGGEPVVHLNELECVGADVYANVWLTDEIVRIDRATGAVLASIDASGLLTPEEKLRSDVLNGIAYVPTTGRFLITGKLWPKLFEVEFVPSASP